MPVNRFVLGGEQVHIIQLIYFSWFFCQSLGCVLYKCAYYIHIFTIHRSCPLSNTDTKGKSVILVLNSRMVDFTTFYDCKDVGHFADR